MNLTQAIHRNSVFYFVALIGFAVWGFWATYFTADSPVAMEHVHGVVMFAWCLLLVLQAWLIRSGERSLHRLTGQLSYLLAPLIALSTLLLAHHKLVMRGLEGFGPMVFGLQLFLLLQFLLIYGLAIAHRRSPDVHARYMVGTVFPMLDPIFNRILSIPLAVYFPSLPDQAIFITFGSILLIVSALAWIDRKEGYPRPVFLHMLGILLVTQLAILAPLFSPAYAGWWKGIAGWYLALPLP